MQLVGGEQNPGVQRAGGAYCPAVLPHELPSLPAGFPSGKHPNCAPAPGTALPGVPATLAAAARKSAGLLLMRVALMLRRGRIRTPERGVMERGVMSAAGRGGPPDSRPAGRCVRPTLYSGAGDTCAWSRRGGLGQRAVVRGWPTGTCQVGEQRQVEPASCTFHSASPNSRQPPPHLGWLREHAIGAGGNARSLHRLRRHQRSCCRRRSRLASGGKAEGWRCLAGAKQAGAAKGWGARSAKQAGRGGSKGRGGCRAKGRRAGGAKPKPGRRLLVGRRRGGAPR